MAEEPPCSARNTNRNEEGKDESVGVLLHAVDQVHAKERGNERGEHHDNGDAGERTHHCVHIVVDDAAIGVHRRFQDVGVDAGRFACLRHLDVDVLDKVGVQLVNLQLELQL